MKVEESSGKTISLFGNQTPEEKVELLFRQYYSPLCKSLFRTLRDPSLAEDIVQEVFLKIWDKRATLSIDAGISAYLYRASYNTALNFLKSQKTNLDIEGLTETLRDNENAEKDLNFQETEAHVLRAIGALPPKTKLVFSMSRFEELSYREIAERLDISLKSVEKHMGIALQKLRENLKEYLVILLLSLLSDNF